MIMAGGAGTRLWPMSRAGRPKQLLRFIEREDGGAKSLIELAAERLEGLIDSERRYICTAEAYRGAILDALPGFDGGRILGEPMGRDTLNAVGLAAAVFEKIDRDAIFAVLTADHVIEPVEKFQELMDLGFRLVETDPTRLVTFSIKPTYASTGFGYVERGAPIASSGPGGVPGSAGLAFKVARFVEKPDHPRAEAYFRSGVFGWNSGMFVWKASTVLSCLERFRPATHAGLMKIRAAWGTTDQERVLAEVYPTLEKISVDYALMEPAARDKQVSVCTVLMDLTWLDVGSWPAFGETVAADAEGNRVAGEGDAVLLKSRDCLVVGAGAGHTVALLGCEDLIVVRTADATLVMPRARAEELKELHARLAEGLK